MAAEIFGVGQSKIWIDETQLKKAIEAMTRDDIRNLIRERVVRKRQDNYQSKGRARILHAKKRVGRKSGPGKRKGTKKARTKPKEQWMNRVRALRKKLKEIKKEGALTKNYQIIYRQVKGNVFRGKKHLESAVTGGKTK
jgi:large subunit ribosomal protein L19e